MGGTLAGVIFLLRYVMDNWCITTTQESASLSLLGHDVTPRSNRSQMLGPLSWGLVDKGRRGKIVKMQSRCLYRSLQIRALMLVPRTTVVLRDMDA